MPLQGCKADPARGDFPFQKSSLSVKIAGRAGEFCRPFPVIVHQAEFPAGTCIGFRPG